MIRRPWYDEPIRPHFTKTPRFRRGGELIEEMRRARDARSLDLATTVDGDDENTLS